MINYITGNLIHSIKDYDNPAVVHIINNLGVAGAGFIVPLYMRYPNTKKAYHAYAQQYNYDIPQGQVLFTLEKDCSIFNCVAQQGIKTVNGIPPFRAESLKLCFTEVANSLPHDVKIIMPRIGAGLSGGKWTDIEAIINEYLADYSVDVFTLPNETHLFENNA